MSIEIYTLDIRFPTSPKKKWSKTIEISEQSSLIDLHTYIQEIVDFDDDHLYEFFAGKSYTKKEIDYSEKYGEYSNILLNQIYPMDGLKLYYIFDFGDYWVFEITKTCQKISQQENIKYPRLVKSLGKNPVQYPDYED